MKRKYLNIFEWLSSIDGTLTDMDGNEIYYNFAEIYQFKDKIRNIYNVLMKMSFPQIYEKEKIKRIFQDLDITLPGYFEKKEYMYSHLMSAIRCLYAQHIHAIGDDKSAESATFYKDTLEKKNPCHFDQLSKEEQRHIEKAVSSWKLKRSTSYMENIARVYLFYQYLDMLKQGETHDLIKEIGEYLKHITEEDVVDYIKEYGSRNMVAFFYKEYFVYYFLNEKKQALFTIKEDHAIVVENSVEEILFDCFSEWKEIDFFFINVYMKHILQIVKEQNVEGNIFKIQKKEFLTFYNKYITSNAYTNYFLRGNLKELNERSRTWTNFLATCTDNHPLILKEHHHLLIKHKL